MFCSTDVSESLHICPLYNLKKLLGQRAHPECSLSCVLGSCCEMTLTFLAFILHRDLSLTFHSLSCLSELISFSFLNSQSNLQNKCWAYSRTMHWCEFTHKHTHTHLFLDCSLFRNVACFGKTAAKHKTHHELSSNVTWWKEYKNTRVVKKKKKNIKRAKMTQFKTKWSQRWYKDHQQRYL